MLFLTVTEENIALDVDVDLKEDLDIITIIVMIKNVCFHNN